jgi:TRAP-type C4-dicarboxylate transport system permease small subunit
MTGLATIYIVLFLVSLLFGSLPFIGVMRELPRWIRIALFMIGLSFFVGAAGSVALHLSADSLPRPMHDFLSVQIKLIVGMAIGIFLLLLISGEYFKALRELDGAYKKRLAATQNSEPTKTSNPIERTAPRSDA